MCKEQLMRFLDVKTDYAFKKVFGSENSKHILISFLNALIDFPEDAKIVDLTIVDPYQIPLVKGMKDTYIDVKVQLSNKKRVIVEMQVLNYEGLEKRILYNAAKAYSSQLKKSEEFKTLEPIIALTITEFVMFKEIDNLITYFKLIEKDMLLLYSDDIELIFIELPKFTKNENTLNTITDKWIFFIKNAGKLEYIPESLKSEEPIREAFEIANTAGMSEQELEEQWKRKEFIQIQKGAIEFAEKTGIEKGKKLGRKEGIKETAKKMLDIGVDIKLIIQVTGLSEVEIKSLR